MKKEIKVIITLFVLIILTIFGALLALNRQAGLPFNFGARIFIEHFFTGFYAPLVLFSLAYVGQALGEYLSCGKLYWPSKKISYFYLIFSSLIILLFEIWWQFVLSCNAGSLVQMVFLVLGMILAWGYLFWTKFFD